jgi:exopolysaccharide biosynthesis polyprenyl glycosylphosphotransferase
MMASNKAPRRPIFLRLRSGERRFILFIGDLVAVGLAMLLSLVAWSQSDWLDLSMEFLHQRLPFWFYLLPLLWLLLNFQLYDIRRASQRRATLINILGAAGIGLFLYLIIFFVSNPDIALPRRGVAIFIASAALLTLLWRMAYIAIFTTPMFMRRALIVGAGRAGAILAQIIRKAIPPPFYLVGYIDDDEQKMGALVENYPVLGNSDMLEVIVEKEHISDLILAISGDLNAPTYEALLRTNEKGIHLSTMPMIYENLLGRVPINLLQSDWIIRSFVDQTQVGSFYELFKRLTDILGALVGLVLTALTLPLIALIILIDDGMPIYFRQDRLGKNGKEFGIFKFRTMVRDAEKDGKARVTVENDERITRAGKFLRRSHLDELPQFINVLTGEMSLVGPRAERLELVRRLQTKVPFYRARLLVKPGITGWAQVNFGYAATVEDTGVKLEYDLYYIKHRNLWMDIVILLRTVKDVVGFKGR